MSATDDEYQVLISGAGPVGLALAGELRLHGVSTLVVDRLPPGGDEPRVLTLHSRTLETLDRRGLLDDFVAAEERLAGLAEFRRQVANTSARGHFAGLFGLGKGTVRTEQPREVAVAREDAKEILAGRAIAAGACVRYGAEVVALDQDETGATATVAGPRGQDRVRAGFVVGCDGGRSAVRRLAGIAFPGDAPSLVSWTGLATVGGEVRLPLGWRRTPRGWLMWLADGRISTLEWDLDVDPTAPVTVADLADSIQRVTGQRVALTDVRAVTRFTDSTRLAEHYRSGRVLLAGDAAHVHFPAAGQGANLGVQDAVNLGWKLVAACQGWAPPALLDSYHAERRPVAERALRNTQAQVALMRPGPQGDALRELFAELMDIPAVNTRLTSQINGIDVSYRGGNCPGGDDPRVGSFVPDRPLATDCGPTRLAELLRDGRPLLLDGTGGRAAAATAAAWADRVMTVSARPGVPDAALMLIRPDGYLAWTGADPANALRTALTAWCGPAGRQRPEPSGAG